MELPGYKSLVLLVAVIPMIAATLMGMFGFWTLTDWSWIAILYYGAVDIGRSFVIWKQGMLEAGNNKTEELLFVHTPDEVWIALGSLRFALKVAAGLQRFAMCNILLVLSVSLFKHTTPLTRVFKLLGSQLSLEATNPQAQHDQSQFEATWKYYFRLRKTSLEMNRAFGGVIKCTHTTNTLSLLVILLYTVLSEHTVLSFILSLYEVLLIISFYILATKVNQVVRIAFEITPLHIITLSFQSTYDNKDLFRVYCLNILAVTYHGLTYMARCR